MPYGKLTLKVYSKGEGVLRIELMVHNTQAFSPGRKLDQLPRLVAGLKEIPERFLKGRCYVDRCFIAGDLLDRLPAFSVAGATRVGGVDLNQARMRMVIQGVVSLWLSPAGFSASELAGQVRAQSGQAEAGSRPRRAACHLKKLRGKGLVHYEKLQLGMQALFLDLGIAA